MNMNELFPENVPGYHSAEDDESRVHSFELRKTKLTLKHLNKLRMMHDVRTMESEAKLELLSRQYGSAGGDTGMGGF